MGAFRLLPPPAPVRLAGRFLPLFPAAAESAAPPPFLTNCPPLLLPAGACSFPCSSIDSRTGGRVRQPGGGSKGGGLTHSGAAGGCPVRSHFCASRTPARAASSIDKGTMAQRQLLVKMPFATIHPVTDWRS